MNSSEPPDRRFPLAARSHERSDLGFFDVPLPELLGAQDRLPPPLLPPGTLVKERYRIQKLVADRGSATVYLALDETLAGKRVVLKVLDRWPNSSTLQSSFQAEIESLARLNHPHVVALSDAGYLPEGTPFLVLGYVAGPTLRQILAHGPLPVERCRRLLTDVGQALAVAHRLGIWHLDVKPENIIVSQAGTPEEHATLVDFGIAQLGALTAGDAKIRRGGTAGYMAPEQYLSPSMQCDIYALGVVAREMLTGSAHGPLSPSLAPAAMRAAIAQATHIDPARRPTDVAEFSSTALGSPSRPGSRRVWGALAAAIALGATLAWRTSPRSHQSLELRAVPLVTSRSLEYRPAFSADGAWIYFASGNDGLFDIFRQSVAGGPPLPLVTHPLSDDYPAPSPDGRTLAFIRTFPHHFAIMLRRFDASATTSGNTAGNEVELRRESDLGSIAWLPDSRHLVISSPHPPDDTFRLDVFDTETLDSRILLHPQPGTRGDRSPAISPDGRTLAFVRRWTQATADLFVLSLNQHLQPSGPPRQVTFQNERIENVQWTPDGQQLIYGAGPLGHAAIQRVRLAGGAPERLPGLDRDVEKISIPPRVWKLAYSVHRSDSNVWRLALEGPMAATPVLSSSYDDEEPRVSPHGRLIAFSSGRSGSEQIWVADANGENPRQITFIPGADSMGVAWSRDSRELIISVRKKGEGDRVYRAAANGAFGPMLLLRDARVTDMSQDGRWLYLIRSQAQPRKLWKTPYPAADRLIQVTDAPADFARESIDGRRIYFSQRQESEGLWLQPPAGEPVRRVVDRLYRRNLFVPARDGVYYIDRPPADPFPSLYFLQSATGRITRLKTFDHDIFWGLDLSPDGRQLLYSQFDVANSDIMLVPDFR